MRYYIQSDLYEEWIYKMVVLYEERNYTQSGLYVGWFYIQSGIYTEWFIWGEFIAGRFYIILLNIYYI